MFNEIAIPVTDGNRIVDRLHVYRCGSVQDYTVGLESIYGADTASLREIAKQLNAIADDLDEERRKREGIESAPAPKPKTPKGKKPAGAAKKADPVG